jgi:hypothetical protein
MSDEITSRSGTAIYGQLIQIGGLPPRATILMSNGRFLDIDLDRSQVLELARDDRLYQDIAIEGSATWQTGTWEILAFQATRITEYQPHLTSLSETFKALAKASAGRWDGIDAVRYVKELRS